MIESVTLFCFRSKKSKTLSQNLYEQKYTPFDTTEQISEEERPS